MSKTKSTQKKAAQGKARPKTPARTQAKPAPKAKKAPLKPAPKKKPKPLPPKKVAPAKKAASARKPTSDGKPLKKPFPAKAVTKAPAPSVAKKPVAKAPAKPVKQPAKPSPAPKAPVTKAAPPPPASKAPAKAVAVQKSLSVPKAAAVPTAPPTTATAPPPPTVVEIPARKPSAPLPPPGPTKSGALFYDSHMHTPLCKHAWGEPEEYAQQAVKAGLKGIIFTCHCPMPDGFWPTVRMAESEFDTYVALVQRAADAFKGKLDIRLGIESEYFPGHEDYIAKLHQRADFHYVLGAVHWQAKEYLNKFETGTIENFRRTYFEHLAKSAESGLYDCLAHPDLVKNYHPDSWCFAIVKNTVATALDRIAATGVAMELNTSGLNKSYPEMNPGNEMLRMMAERKIPVVVGSDSHRAPRVGEHFVTALNNLTEAGYEKVCYFLNRQRIDLKISDVLASLKKAADHNA